MAPGHERVLAFLNRITDSFDSVIEWVFVRGSIAQFPRVVQYLTKENGGTGWHDTYQNLFIDRLCKSRWFARESDTVFICRIDGTRWRRDIDEWRMGAERNQLVRLSPTESVQPGDALGAEPEAVTFFSEDFFRTAGFEPGDVVPTDLAGVVRYLTRLKTGEFLDIAPASQLVNSKHTTHFRRMLGRLRSLFPK